MALLKGIRLGFECSSDHHSTHISYCNVYVEKPTREEILKAMKARHVYGSTDNIVADVRWTAGGEEHFMGDEFTATQGAGGPRSPGGHRAVCQGLDHQGQPLRVHDIRRNRPWSISPGPTWSRRPA